MRQKWKTIVMFQLRNGGMGWRNWKRGIEGITRKCCCNIWELGAFGLIGKKNRAGRIPLRVTYFLTERGKSCLLGRAGPYGISAWNTPCWRTWGEPTFCQTWASSLPPRGIPQKVTAAPPHVPAAIVGTNTRKYGMNSTSLDRHPDDLFPPDILNIPPGRSPAHGRTGWR